MHKIKQFLKLLLGTELLLKLYKGNRFIFVYHDVSNQNSTHYSKHYSTPIGLFTDQMTLLNKIFEIISLEEIVTNKNLNNRKNYAAITFDDGFLSVLHNADPILKKSNIPYTIFLNGAAIDHNQLWVSNLEILKYDNSYAKELLELSETNPMIDEDLIFAIVNRGKFDSKFRQDYKRKKMEPKVYMDGSDICKLIENQVEIGNHSYDHFVLGSTKLSDLRTQINENHELLFKLTNKDIRHFAIPFGKKEHFNISSISELKASKYNYIYTTNPNKFRSKDLNDKNFLFPRIGVTQETPKQLLFYINRSILRNHNL